MSGQIKQRAAARAIRKVYPTEREVLLARLLLRVCDAIWEDGDGGPEADSLYNDVKHIAEGVVRGTPS